MLRWVLCAAVGIFMFQDARAQFKKSLFKSQRAMASPCVVTYDTNIVIKPAFHMTANGAGPVPSTVGYEKSPPPEGFNAYSADFYRDVLNGAGGSVRDIPGGMQVAGGIFFIMAGGGPNFTHDDAQGRWFRYGQHYASYNYDAAYEIRFTASGGKGYTQFGTRQLIDVPFEVWHLGTDKFSSLDDVRMIPAINDEDSNSTFNFHWDHAAAADSNDPYSDWIYFYYPTWNSSPGDAGYQSFVATPSSVSLSTFTHERLARVVIVNYNRRQGESTTKANDGPWDAMPEAGTIFRIDTRLDTVITSSLNNVEGIAVAAGAINQSSTSIETFDSVTVVNDTIYQHRADLFQPGLRGDSIFWNYQWWVVQDVQYATLVGSSIGGVIGQIGFKDWEYFTFNTSLGILTQEVWATFVITEHFECNSLKEIAANNWK